MKVSDLSYPALDWAVCKTAGFDEDQFSVTYNPSTAASYSLPIIFREGISTIFCGYETENDPVAWAAVYGGQDGLMDQSKWFYGPTPLVAGMRCFVASKLGDVIEVPEEWL